MPNDLDPPVLKLPASFSAYYAAPKRLTRQGLVCQHGCGADCVACVVLRKLADEGYRRAMGAQT